MCTEFAIDVTPETLVQKERKMLKLRLMPLVGAQMTRT